MNYQQAFDKIRTKLFGKAKISAKYGDFAIQVEMTNKDCGGIFYLQHKGNDFYVEPYDYYDNNASVSISYLNFSKLVDGRLKLNDAIAKKLIVINGDSEIVNAVCAVVPEEKAKVEAKKPTKTAAKPAAKKAEPVKKATPEAKKPEKTTTPVVKKAAPAKKATAAKTTSKKK